MIDIFSHSQHSTRDFTKRYHCPVQANKPHAKNDLYRMRRPFACHHRCWCNLSLACWILLLIRVVCQVSPWSNWRDAYLPTYYYYYYYSPILFYIFYSVTLEIMGSCFVPSLTHPHFRGKKIGAIRNLMRLIKRLGKRTHPWLPVVMEINFLFLKTNSSTSHF